MPHYHLDRSGDPPIHNRHDIVLFGTRQQPHSYAQGFSLPPWAAERARQIGHLLHVVSWPHGQQPHPYTIKEPLPPMGKREERIIQSERSTDLDLILLSQRL